MAYKRTIYGRKNAPYNLSEFVCDSATDIENLPTNTAQGDNGEGLYDPCCPGSHAFVIATSKHYMLNTDGEWVQVQMGGGGGGGTVSGLYADDDGEGNVTVTW